MESARKRRKWDVAAPGGMPLTGNRAGIGSGAGSNAGLSGFITAQGFQVAHAAAASQPTPVAAAASFPQPGTDLKPGQPVDQATIARAQQGAQAIVERINAELRAKGQMPPMRGQTRFHDDSKDIAREVPINDAPPPIRYNLTKRSVQDDIQRRTNTIVVIKGRYQAPGTLADDSEGALRLRIMPGNVGPDDMVKQRAVDAGALEVRRILQGGSMSRNTPPVTSIPPPDRVPGFSSAGAQAMQAPVQMHQATPTHHGQFGPHTGSAPQTPEVAQTVPLYVGVEAPQHFNLHQRLRGPGDSYLQHISSTTGATVTLRGRGSEGMYDSPDHLHLFVSATNAKSFEDAKGLCVNLIDTVRAEHGKMFPPQLPMASQPPAQVQTPSPAHLANGPGVNHTPSGAGAANYPQAQPYATPSQPTHSQPYQSHPVAQPPAASTSPYHFQASEYPPTSTYPTPSSYPPSTPSSSYPPSAALRPHASPFPAGTNAPQGQHGGPGHPPHTGQQPGPYQHGMPSQPPSQQYPQYGQPTAPYARPQGPGQGLPEQYAGPGYGQQSGMHPQQQPTYSMPGAHPHVQPGYGPLRPPNPEQGGSGMLGPGQGQNGALRPQPGMSNHELAQQAERKRRFTEQKQESQWNQDAVQQPTMASYGPSHPGGSRQGGSPPAPPEPDGAPLPMGPPPPRPAVQFKMGSMGPPPPRMMRPPGAHVQSHPPVQGLVPYGDDD